jgi:hypothetical protein
MGKQRNWGPTGSSFFNGDRGTLSAAISDGYEVELTLERNEDGRLVCSRLLIEYTATESAPAVPISSRFLQSLGLKKLKKSIWMWGNLLVIDMTKKKRKSIRKLKIGN